jgi:hypothetical protein
MAVWRESEVLIDLEGFPSSFSRPPHINIDPMSLISLLVASATRSAKGHALSPYSFCIPFVGITRHFSYICTVPSASPRLEAYRTMRCDATPGITLVRQHLLTRLSSVRFSVEVSPGLDWHLRERPAWCGEPRNSPRELRPSSQSGHRIQP